MQKYLDIFQKNRIIAGIRNEIDYKYALRHKVKILFFLYGDILNLNEIRQECNAYNKLIFIHVDFIKGVGRDREGIIYLAKNDLCDGIVTTKSNLISIAKTVELISVLRLFLIDSAVLRTAEKLLDNIKPDAIEILPGIASTYFIEHTSKSINIPIIAGGLISNEKEIEVLLNKGILAISTSKKQLW